MGCSMLRSPALRRTVSSSMALTVVCLSLCGCGTTTAYFGPERAKEELAYVKADPTAALNILHWGPRTVALTVNGVSQGFWDSRFAVAPGPNEIVARVARTGFHGSTDDSIEIHFTAEAGLTYVVYATREGVGPWGIGGVPRAWLENARTHVVVAGEPPAGHKSVRQGHADTVKTTPVNISDRPTQTEVSPKPPGKKNAPPKTGAKPQSPPEEDEFDELDRRLNDL